MTGQSGHDTTNVRTFIDSSIERDDRCVPTFTLPHNSLTIDTRQ